MTIIFSGITWTVGKRHILDNLSLTAAAGQFTGIVGPNGSGKSSLLRCLYRAQRPNQGSITLNGRDIRAFTRRELARQLAALVQEPLAECHFTALELVLMGRYPQQSTFSSLNDEDLTLAHWAMEVADLCGLADAPFQTLSGGEKQRVMIARALCQKSPVLVLDEPTNHLDIHHSLSLLGQIKALGRTVIAVLHDLNLAAAYCDQVIVLAKGRTAAAGPPEQVFTPSLLRDIFGVEAEVRREDSTVQLRFLGPAQRALAL